MDRPAWMRFDDDRFDLQIAREHACFEQGYEYGLVTGRAESCCSPAGWAPVASRHAWRRNCAISR